MTMTMMKSQNQAQKLLPGTATLRKLDIFDKNVNNSWLWVCDVYGWIWIV